MSYNSVAAERSKTVHPSVRAIYDYEAQGTGELSLQEGQLIQLTDGPSGGRNYADGWWEGKQLIYVVLLCH